MSYSADDFFFDVIAPKLAELFKDYNRITLGPHPSPEKDPFEPRSIMEKFIGILKDSVEGNGHEKFKKEMLQALMDPHGEDPTIDEVVAEFLSLYSNKDLIIRKLEYSSGNSVISVDFQGFPPDDVS